MIFYKEYLLKMIEKEFKELRENFGLQASNTRSIYKHEATRRAYITGTSDTINIVRNIICDTTTDNITDPNRIPINRLRKAEDVSAHILKRVSPDLIKTWATMGLISSYRLLKNNSGEITDDILLYEPLLIEEITDNLLKKQNKLPEVIPIVLRSARDVPSSLQCISNLNEYMEWKFSCVYFLIYENEVVYVGQSVTLGSRIIVHKDDKLFDRVLYIIVPSDKLTDVEQKFIKELKPKYNTVGNEDVMQKNKENRQNKKEQEQEQSQEQEKKIIQDCPEQSE